jgi:hypothetical protein
VAERQTKTSGDRSRGRLVKATPGDPHADRGLGGPQTAGVEVNDGARADAIGGGGHHAERHGPRWIFRYALRGERRFIEPATHVYESRPAPPKSGRVDSAAAADQLARVAMLNQD